MLMNHQLSAGLREVVEQDGQKNFLPKNKSLIDLHIMVFQVQGKIS